MAKWLDETRAHGGGDTPEAVLEGLDVAVHKLSWSKDKHVIRLIYLWEMHHCTIQERPNGPLSGPSGFIERHVIHSIACGGIGRRGRYFFDRLARMSEGRPYTLSRHRRVSRRLNQPLGSRLDSKKPSVARPRVFIECWYSIYRCRRVVIV